MEKKPTKKLTIDFPADEYVYLKMACAKKDVSIKEFVTLAIIRSVEDYEDQIDRNSLEEAKQDVADNGTVSWDEVKKEMGWE